MKDSFTILDHGDAGVGKSWFLASGRPPVLIIDLEGRGRRLPYPKLFWDAASESPPTLEQLEEAGATHCVFTTTKFAGVERAFQWLQTDQHPFKTVCVDSLTFAQKRFIDSLGTNQLQQQEWGEVLRALENLVRDFTDLPLSQNNPVETVAMSVGTRSLDGKFTPLLQGALKDTIPYMFDAVGYMYLAPDNQGVPQRLMQVQPSTICIAKDGTNALGGPVVRDPDLQAFTDLVSNYSYGG